MLRDQEAPTKAIPDTGVGQTDGSWLGKPKRRRRPPQKRGRRRAPPTSRRRQQATTPTKGRALLLLLPVCVDFVILHKTARVGTACIHKTTHQRDCGKARLRTRGGRENRPTRRCRRAFAPMFCGFFIRGMEWEATLGLRSDLSTAKRCWRGTLLRIGQRGSEHHLARAFATTTKICTGGGSRPAHAVPFYAHHRALLLAGASRPPRRSP